MKQFVAKYLLYIYLGFIKDDEIEYYKNFAKPFIKHLTFIHDVYIWILSIIFFPILVIGMIIESSEMFIKIKNIYLNQNN
jgi:hypothetical protein